LEHLALMIEGGVVTATAIRAAISRVPYTFLMPAYREALAQVEGKLVGETE
jgi:hypothetical protein